MDGDCCVVRHDIVKLEETQKEAGGRVTQDPEGGEGQGASQHGGDSGNLRKGIY